MGKPVIKGTRLSVEFIIMRLAQGRSHEGLLESHPGLTREDIHACLAHASEFLESSRLDRVY